MGSRIDGCRVEVDIYIEFEGSHTARFELPPAHPLVRALLDWNSERLRALAVAAGQAAVDIG